MSLQPFRPVDRRTSWRVRIPLWDRETFQINPIGRLGQAQNATVAFALFPEHEECGWRCGWRDYGWCRPWTRRPRLSVSTDDGTNFLTLEAPSSDAPNDPAQAVILNVPPYQVGALHSGVYRTSLVALYADGTVIDLGSETVVFRGELAPTGFNGPMMAGGFQGAGIPVPVNGIAVTMPPVLPAPFFVLV